jgi:hypothetical protein
VQGLTGLGELFDTQVVFEGRRPCASCGVVTSSLFRTWNDRLSNRYKRSQSTTQDFHL